MGVEKALRAWAIRSGFQRSRIIVAGYRLLSRLRFRGRWETPVSFRGASFTIGRDLSLYPAVHNGGFESHELDALLARVEPGDTVWDVGSNVGIYSVILGRAARLGHVVAFEPVPATRERLEGNLRRNAVANVTVESVALSDYIGEATMAIYADAPGCDHIVVDERPEDATGSLRIPTTTGAQYAAMSPHGVPDVVKVDIEGHEPEFLRGAWELFRQRKPTLLIEVNPQTWVGHGRLEVWQQLLDDLFGLYGDGLWFDVDGSRRVQSVDAGKIGRGPINVLLPAT